ncbi:MAG: carbohydrate ABC transporter permease [Defluviitaleaceae bacterium]|nr:carbohydrate ABC transporter permease [Defluviitaleaceae bacterium]MCL2274463.1 carbohydrate ABC transporter permease [Defluviitaleaceae bacterium]
MNKTRTGIIRDYDASRLSVKIALVIVYILCGLIVLVAMFPIYWVIMAGFMNLREFMSSTNIHPEAFELARYTQTWRQLGIMRNYLNSLYLILGSVFFALVSNGLLAYGLSILKPKGWGIIHKLVMVSLLIPTTLALVPLFMSLTRFGLVGFFTPLWMAAGANAFYVVVFRQFFLSLPSSLIDAGRIDGCTQMGIFMRIVMPLSKPICVVITIFTVNGAWSDFLLPFLVLRGTPWQTVMVRLFEFSTQQTINHDDLMRAVVFSMIPPIILFFFFQKKLTENIVSVGIKG